MSDVGRLVVAWVSARQRHYRQSTRGIATVEQRLEWEREAEGIIAAHDREVAAKALREAADRFLRTVGVPGDPECSPIGLDMVTGHITTIGAWLLARADQIKAGEVDV